MGWGEAQEEDPSQEEGINSWLHPDPAPEPDKLTRICQLAGKSRLEQDLDRQVLKGMEKEKEKKEKEDADGQIPVPFVFQKKGKITKKESEELRRTHKDLNHWFLPPKRAGLEAPEDTEQVKMSRELRLKDIKKKRAAWEVQRLCRAMANELLEAALLGQEEADQGDHGEDVLEEGCTLTSVVDPANVDQTGWKSSQGVQGSGVCGGGGAITLEPGLEVEMVEKAAAHDDDNKNAKNVESGAPASIEMLKMIDINQQNLKSSPCAILARTAHSDKVVNTNIVDWQVLREDIQRVEADNFEELNMNDVNQVLLKSSPCARDTRTAHSEDMVISDIVRQAGRQEHIQHLEPVITVQFVHTPPQSNLCTLVPEDTHAMGVLADRGVDMTSEMFSSVRNLVEEWERKEEEGVREDHLLDLHPPSLTRRKSSEFLKKLSIYEEGCEENPQADLNSVLHIDRVEFARVKKIESEYRSTVSNGKSENLLLADNLTNGSAGLEGALWNKGNSGDGDR